jgi:branched-subunit amino acid transport protein AzlD
MTFAEQLITILLCVAATMLTRFLPFALFSRRGNTPAFIRYLGNALPAAIFAMLVVYCLKDVDLTAGWRGLPEAIGIAATVALHILSRRNMLVSIGGGTLAYMVLVQNFLV